MWIYAYTGDRSTACVNVTQWQFSAAVATALTSTLPKHKSLYRSAYSSATSDSSVMNTWLSVIIKLITFHCQRERVTKSTGAFLSVGKLSLFCWMLVWSLKYIRLWRNVQHNLKSHCLRITKERLRRFGCVVVAVKDPELRNYSVVLVCRCQQTSCPG